MTADDFDMYTLGFGVEVDPDEYRTYLQSQYCPPNGMNFITYSNPEVDKLFGGIHSDHRAVGQRRMLP